MAADTILYRSFSGRLGDVTQRFISPPSTLVGRSRPAAPGAQWEKFVAVDILAAACQVPVASRGVAGHQSIARPPARLRRNRAISPPVDVCNASAGEVVLRVGIDSAF